MIGTTHKFTPAHVETRWDIVRRLRERYTVDVLFPLVGQDRARRSGDARRPAGDPRRRRARSGVQVSLRDVMLLLPCRRGNRLRRRADGQTPARDGAHHEAGRTVLAPRPGPTLALQLVRGRRFRRLGLAVRIAPAATRLEAGAGRPAPAPPPPHARLDLGLSATARETAADLVRGHRSAPSAARRRARRRRPGRTGRRPLAQLGDRDPRTQGMPIRPVRGHRVVGITGEDDAALDRYVGAMQPVRVAVAVPALVGVTHDPSDVLQAQASGAAAAHPTRDAGA